MMLSSPDETAQGPRRCAIVVGSAGQDGRLLGAELRRDGYSVVGIERSGIRDGDGAIRPFDITDRASADRLIEEVRPNEIYYLAAHHHSSEEDAGALSDLLDRSFAVHCRGLVGVLDAVARTKPDTRLFYASSCHVFGHPDSAPQNEATPIRPVSAYALTKAAGMNICRLYREQAGLFCCSGILFNHESAYRHHRFVSRKIVSAAVDIKLGMRTELALGSLDATADWGAASDTVRAMRAMLALDRPDDFVVATGKLHSVRDFAAAVFSALGMDYLAYVKVVPGLIQRITGAVPLVGDAAKLKNASGWSPRAGFADMILGLVTAEMQAREGAWRTS